MYRVSSLGLLDRTVYLEEQKVCKCQNCLKIEKCWCIIETTSHTDISSDKKPTCSCTKMDSDKRFSVFDKAKDYYNSFVVAGAL